jgi:hypothetical protein
MSPEPASIFSMPLVYDGIGVVVGVAALVSYLFLRRKPSRAVVTSGVASTPVTQA